MTGFFSVTNYDQQQHYKDRGPTWIKLYNRLLDDYAFAMLPDAAKWHLIGIFLLASRHSNRIPCDPQWLARQIGASSPVNLALMERAGFIARVEDASDLSGNPASPEKNREETETETETEKNPLSAGADPSGLFEGVFPAEGKKKSYPDDFQNFWKSYPTDPLMSKVKAFEQWRRLPPADRVAAQAALPAFREFVAKQVNYRTVHAQRYLSERRCEGFASMAAPDADAVAAARDRADRLLKRGKYAENYA
jgi:hypothetical protein